MTFDMSRRSDVAIAIVSPILLLAAWQVAVMVDLDAGRDRMLLQHGALRVWAVDVGKGQLHERIRGDARVLVREGINARLGLRETTTLDHEKTFWNSDTADVKRWSVLPSRLAECAAQLGGAQYREQLEINTKINRPRQIYTGESLRKVTPRSER